MREESDALREYAGSKLQARQGTLQDIAQLAQARFPRVF